MFIKKYSAVAFDNFLSDSLSKKPIEVLLKYELLILNISRVVSISLKRNILMKQILSFSKNTDKKWNIIVSTCTKILITPTYGGF